MRPGKEWLAAFDKPLSETADKPVEVKAPKSKTTGGTQNAAKSHG